MFQENMRFRWLYGAIACCGQQWQRERGSGSGSPQVRGSGGSCNSVQEMSYSKIFLIFGTLRVFMMTTNLFVIANVKQLRTGGSSRVLLPFFRTSWSVGVLNSAIFNSFHNRVEFGTILEDLWNFGSGVNPPPPRYATGGQTQCTGNGCWPEDI